MTPLIKKHRWSCSTASLAMVLDEPEENLFSEIGHNGSKILDPLMVEPLGREGFHIQELIDYCLVSGFSATSYQVVPCSQIGEVEHPIHSNKRTDRFIEFVQNAEGIIQCMTTSGKFHAVAFSEGTIVDPDSADTFDVNTACDATSFFTIFSKQGLYPRELLIVEKMNG